MIISKIYTTMFPPNAYVQILFSFMCDLNVKVTLKQTNNQKNPKKYFSLGSCNLNEYKSL